MARLWTVRAVACDVDNGGGGLRRTACKDVTMKGRAGRAAWTSSDWLADRLRNGGPSYVLASTQPLLLSSKVGYEQVSSFSLSSDCRKCQVTSGRILTSTAPAQV